MTFFNPSVERPRSTRLYFQKFPKDEKFFMGVCCAFVWGKYFSPMGYRILSLRLRERGGVVQTIPNKSTTHIVSSNWSSIVDEFSGCSKCSFHFQSKVHIVSWDWITIGLIIHEKVEDMWFRLNIEGEMASQMK